MSSYGEWKQMKNEQQAYGLQYPTLESQPTPKTQGIKKLDQPPSQQQQQQQQQQQDPTVAYSEGFQQAMQQMGQAPMMMDPQMQSQQPQTNHMLQLQEMDSKRSGTARPGFKTFSQALSDTGISNALSGGLGTQLTVFAPTDDAFKVFGDIEKQKFKGNNPADNAWKESLLESHIVEAEFTPDMAFGKVEEVARGVEANSLLGPGLALRLRPRRDPAEILPPGIVPDDPLVQLIDGNTGKILAQSKITSARWIPGTGTVFSIDKLLIAPKP